jgi:hypothetical protein
VDVNAAIKELQFASEGFLGKIFAVDHLADALDQRMEQGKFNSRKGDLGILLVHCSRTDINGDIIGNDFAWHGRVGTRVFAAPLDCADAGHQFTRIERLGQVIVGTHLQADNPIDFITPGGQHDHRNGGEVAELAQQIKTVQPRQHNIKDEKGVVTGKSGIQPIQGIMDGKNGESLLLQVLGEQVTQFGVVVNDQDIHTKEWGCGYREDIDQDTLYSLKVFAGKVIYRNLQFFADG